MRPDGEPERMAGMKNWFRVYRRVLQVLVGCVFVLGPLCNIMTIIRHMLLANRFTQPR